MPKPIQLFPPLPPERIAARERVREEARAKFGESQETDELIAFLHSRGLSIIDSIATFSELRGCSLGAAKVEVTAHPVWASVVTAHAPLHDALIAELEADPTVIVRYHDGAPNGVGPNGHASEEPHESEHQA